MNKLYIAGDSFASLVRNQDEGVTWTELLAKELNLELINLARPGASNFFICFQIEHIINEINDDDILIIYLTDNSRAVLPNSEQEYPKNAKSILECFDSSHYLRMTKNIPYQDTSKIKGKGKYISSLMNFSKNWRRIASQIVLDDHSKYYKEFFDPYLQFKSDILVMTGILHKLSQKTKNFLVCSGGFGENLDSDLYVYNIDSSLPIFDKTVDAKTFCLDSKNWLKTSSIALENRSGTVQFVNHLDDFCHLVLYKKVLDKLKTDILILSP